MGKISNAQHKVAITESVSSIEVVYPSLFLLLIPFQWCKSLSWSFYYILNCVLNVYTLRYNNIIWAEGAAVTFLTDVFPTHVLQQASLVTPALAKLPIRWDSAIKQQDQISSKCFVISLKWNIIFLPMHRSERVGHQYQKPLQFK